MLTWKNKALLEGGREVLCVGAAGAAVSRRGGLVGVKRGHELGREMIFPRAAEVAAQRKINYQTADLIDKGAGG